MGKSNNVDLSKLRQEIDSRKQVKGDHIHEGNGPAPKDTFLNELLTSLKTGEENSSIKKLKMIEQKAAQKKGENVVNENNSQTMSEAIGKHTNNFENNTPVNATMGRERDDKLYEEFERKQKELLANNGYNSNVVPENRQILSSQKSQVGQINEQQLIEVVKKTIDESFAPIVEEAMKNAIVNIYSNERIKEVITENETLIRNIVISTIRSLQKKNK